VLRTILYVPVASSHYILLAIWAVIYAGLLAGTALYFAKRPVLSPRREARLALAAALVFAATFLVEFFVKRLYFILLIIPFVRYVMVTLLVTVGLRYLRTRRQK
jgi:predicted neutral ceramidase superfamily lipid hydrolase